MPSLSHFSFGVLRSPGPRCLPVCSPFARCQCLVPPGQCQLLYRPLSWMTPLFCCPQVPVAASQGDEAGKGRNERKWEKELTKSSPCPANTSVFFPHVFSPSLLQTSQHRVPLLCQTWNRDDHIRKVSRLRRESPLLPPPPSLLSWGPRILCPYKLFFLRKGSGHFTDRHEGNLWLWQSPPGIFLGLSPFPFLFSGGRTLNQTP